MSHDPFPTASPLPGSHTSLGAPKRSQTWIYVIVVLCSLSLFLGLLLIATTLWTLDHLGVIGRDGVPEPVGIQSDKDAYTAAVGNFLGSNPVDPEIARWIKTNLDEYNFGDQIEVVPYDLKLMIQSVRQSPLSSGMGFDDNITLRFWLDDYFPEPQVLESYTLLGVERETDPATGEPSEFAIADLYFYDGYSEGMSARWYLHRDDDGWKLYDSQRLEYGRRTSDEWANYLSHDTDADADGYDDSKQSLYELEYDYDLDPEVKLERIRAEERRMVLPSDRPVHQLMVAHAYQAAEEYDEVLRVLDGIADPSVDWGVLTTKSFALSALWRYDEAVDVANELLRRSPNHPNGLSALSHALYYGDRDAEGRDSLLRLVLLCPDDYELWVRLLAVAEPDDLQSILAARSSSDDPNAGLHEMLDQMTGYEPSLLKCVQDWRATRSKVTQVPDAFWDSVEAIEVYIDGKEENALEKLAQLSSGDSDGLVKQTFDSLFAHYLQSAMQRCDASRVRRATELLSMIPEPDVTSRLKLAIDLIAINDDVATTTSETLELIQNSSTWDTMSDHYMAYYFATEYLETLIWGGHVDAAQAVIEHASGDENWFDPEELASIRAKLTLRRGDAAELMEALANWDAATVTDWLDDPLVRSLLAANRPVAKQIQEKFVVPHSHSFTENTVVVFNRSAVPIDHSMVQQWCSESLESPYVLSQFESHEGGTGWRVTVNGSTEFLVNVTHAKFSGAEESMDDAESLIDQSEQAVVIELVANGSSSSAVDSTDPFPNQRMIWQTACRALGDESLAIYSNQANAWWSIDSSSSDSLRWVDQLPIEQSTTGISLSAASDAQWRDDAMERLEQAIAEGRTEVKCRVSVTGASEVLDGSLESLDQERGVAVVRLNESSNFDFLLEQGNLVQFYAASVESVNP